MTDKMNTDSNTNNSNTNTSNNNTSNSNISRNPIKSGKLNSNAKRNYQKELDHILGELPDHNRTLFLHSCCAPCSSYVLEYLSGYFQITVYYYNPNISEKTEYDKRVQEQIRLIKQFNEKIRKERMNAESEAGEVPMDCSQNPIVRNEIRFQEGPYEPDQFYDAVRGLEKCKEGGERCEKCFRLRLEQTAKEAQRQGYDYFATTLTISPLKNAELLNEIGQQVQKQVANIGCNNGQNRELAVENVEAQSQLQFLHSDFKKKNGYKRSIELSKEYDLYRQDYCGCIFSKMQREEEQRDKEIQN